MTERIDLDELDGGDDEETDEPNPGDWLWRGEGSPGEEPDPPQTTGPAVEQREADSEAPDEATSDPGAAVGNSL